MSEIEHRLNAKWRWWLLGEPVRQSVIALMAQLGEARTRISDGTLALNLAKEAAKAAEARAIESENAAEAAKQEALLAWESAKKRDAEADGRVAAAKAELLVVEDAVKDAKHAGELETARREEIEKRVAEMTVEVKALRAENLKLKTQPVSERERELRDRFHLAQVDLGEVRRRLSDEQKAHGKTKENVGRLWNFIATRNKPVSADGIKALLDNLNKPKT